jgi:ADP-ribose pyrophosphatase
MTSKDRQRIPEHLREERVTGRRIYAGRIVTLDVDEVRLPGGGQAVREVVRHPGAIVVLAVTENREIVLERQFRYPAGQVLLELPAGTLGAGEQPQACAERELAEETGYTASDWRSLGAFFTAPGFSDEQIHAFAALGARRASERNLDDDERIDVLLLAPQELDELIRQGEVRDAKTIACLSLSRLAGLL